MIYISMLFMNCVVAPTCNNNYWTTYLQYQYATSAEIPLGSKEACTFWRPCILQQSGVVLKVT